MAVQKDGLWLCAVSSLAFCLKLLTELICRSLRFLMWDTGLDTSLALKAPRLHERQPPRRTRAWLRRRRSAPSASTALSAPPSRPAATGSAGDALLSARQFSSHTVLLLRRGETSGIITTCDTCAVPHVLMLENTCEDGTISAQTRLFCMQGVHPGRDGGARQVPVLPW